MTDKTLSGTLPIALAKKVEAARKAQPSMVAALIALESLDLTSLNDNDTPESIAELLAKADQGDLGHVAATCVYPKFLTQAFNSNAAKGINCATVINFPSGKGTIEQTIKDTKAAIASGANEIDIVLDYQGYLSGGINAAEDLLRACRAACGDDVRLKVILETAAFNDAEALRLACHSALECGADFLKTSTGKKEPLGGATLEAAAVMLQAIKEAKSNAGLKISGGVKTVANCAQYIALTESMMGEDWISPSSFRFGASSVLNDILQVMGKKPATAPQKPATPGSNY